MRTTPDLPDALMPELRARAELEGVKLNDYLATAAQTALQRPASGDVQPARNPLPVLKRPGAKAMPSMTNAELYAVLDQRENMV